MDFPEDDDDFYEREWGLSEDDFNRPSKHSDKFHEDTRLRGRSYWTPVPTEAELVPNPPYVGRMPFRYVRERQYLSLPSFEEPEETLETRRYLRRVSRRRRVFLQDRIRQIRTGFDPDRFGFPNLLEDETEEDYYLRTGRYRTAQERLDVINHIDPYGTGLDPSDPWHIDTPPGGWQPYQRDMWGPDDGSNPDWPWELYED